MGRADDGRVILAGLTVDIRFGWITHLRVVAGLPARPWLLFRAWSDAAEITARIARNAGQIA